MKYIYFLFFFVTIISMTSCSNKVTIWSKKYCKLERLEFQEVTEIVHIKKNGKLKTGIVANGNVIINDKISVDSMGASLNAGNKVFINRTTLRVVKVSQNFYEKYSSNRKSLCDLIEGIKKGPVKSDEGLKRAETLYLDIIEMFAGIEKKKYRLNYM